jgi:hypothetical protein
MRFGRSHLLSSIRSCLDEATRARAAFDSVWDPLGRGDRELLQLLIERVDYDPKEVAITFRRSGIASLAGEQRSAA